MAWVNYPATCEAELWGIRGAGAAVVEVAARLRSGVEELCYLALAKSELVFSVLRKNEDEDVRVRSRMQDVHVCMSCIICSM